MDVQADHWLDTLNSINDAITVHDREYNIIFANRAAERFFDHGQPLTGKCYEAYHGTGKPPKACPTCACMTTGEEIQNQFFEPHLGKHLDVRAIPLRDASGEITGIIHITRDVTGIKRLESDLDEALSAKHDERARFFALADHISDGINILDPDFRILYQNSAHRLHTNGDATGTLCFERIHGRGGVCPKCAVAGSFMDGLVHTMESVQPPERGGAVVEVTASPVKDADGNVKAVIEIVRDVTERNRLQREIAESRESYRSLFNNALVGIFRSKLDGSSMETNATFKRMFGLPPDDERARPDDLARFCKSPSDSERFASGLQEHGRVDHFVLEMLRTDGSAFWAEMSAKLFPAERIIEGVVIDVTDRKEAEDGLRQSLHEKDMLIKEVHHRVKNNLAVIQSLLALQSRKTDDSSSRELLRESESRVRSMGMIHGMLYQSDDFRRVDAARYLRSLVSQIMNTYRMSESMAHADLRLDAISLDVDTLIPCGLIVNELVSNALKYAFPPGSTGTLLVELVRDGNRLRLSVSDNGPGLAPDIDPSFAKTLGLRLVASLCQQLDGTLSVDRAGGTSFTITFTEPRISQ
jgi:PAS domain S-box-containing protein